MGRMGLVMLLCCLVPLAALVILPALGLSLGSFGPLLIAVLCPLLMVAMMWAMKPHSPKQ
jgi:hypothetical protein